MNCVLVCGYNEKIMLPPPPVDVLEWKSGKMVAIG